MKRYIAFYLVVKDDFCLKESCESLKSQGVNDFFFGVPKKYWNGKTVPKKDIDKIFEVARRFNGFVDCSVDPSEFEDDSLMSFKEAMVRNEYLTHIQLKYSTDHVIVVDSDEIWVKGAVEKLDNAVSKNMVYCVAVPSLPVVGCPGYPVISRQEGLLVYINSDTTTFIDGRSPSKPTFQIRGDPLVIHFTATRKTLKDVVDKHVKSCHYDNPAYDFDGWLKNKLPKLKPGERDCFISEKEKVWDVVRNFTQEEWSMIPDRLKKYLGEPPK